MSDDVQVTIGNGEDVSVTMGSDEVSVTLGAGVREVFKRQTFTGDGSTTEFTLDFTPKENSLRVWLQGILQDEDTEYSLSEATITFGTAPRTGRKIEVWYAVA